MIFFCFRCTIDFKILPLHDYHEDCNVNVDHICDKYHYPYKKPKPVIHDSYGPPPPPPIPAVPVPHVPNREHGNARHIPVHDQILLDQYRAHVRNVKLEDPNAPPPPQLQISSPSHALPPQSQLMAVRLFSRSKRNAQNSEMSELQMKELLTAAVLREMKELQERESPTTEMSNIVDQIFQEKFASRTEEIKRLTSNNPSMSSILGGTLDTESVVPFLESEIIEEINRRKLLNTVNGGNITALEDLMIDPIGEQVVSPKAILPSPGVVVDVPIPVPDHPPKPRVTVEELPSDDPECRTLATKTCYNTPIIINKKVRNENNLIVASQSSIFLQILLFP